MTGMTDQSTDIVRSSIVAAVLADEDDDDDDDDGTTVMAGTYNNTSRVCWDMEKTKFTWTKSLTCFFNPSPRNRTLLMTWVEVVGWLVEGKYWRIMVRIGGRW